jgi:hypothetical protein
MRTMVAGLLPSRAGRTETLPAQRWIDQAARLLAPPAPTRQLFDVTAVVLGRPRDGVTLDTLLDALEAGHVRQLAERLTRVTEATEDETHWAMGKLTDALFGVIAHSLVDAGLARWRMRWTGPSQLMIDEVGPDGVDTTVGANINALVFGAVDHHSNVERLRFHLIALGLNPGLPPPVETSTTATASTTVHVNQEAVIQARARRRGARIAAGAALAVIVTVWMLGAIIPKSPVYPVRFSTPSIFPTSPPYAFTPNPYYSYLNVPPTYHMPIQVPSLGQLLDGTIVVQSGDTLSSIARCHATTAAELQQLNNLGSSTVIYPGEALTVPNPFVTLNSC